MEIGEADKAELLDVSNFFTVYNISPETTGFSMVSWVVFPTVGSN